LDINAVVDGDVVVEAFSSGTTFRGFEQLLRGRDPRDATHYTQRICGVCPVSHGMASVKTLENAFRITPLSERFPKYHEIGCGCGNLLAFGVFDTGRGFHLPSGTYRSDDDQVKAFDPNTIGEDLTFSYYHESSGDPAVGKPGAYSWIKAPRYDDTVFEVGPLARMKISGKYERNEAYPGNISVMDRLLARAEESLDVALAMVTWLDSLEPEQPTHEWTSASIDSAGTGLTEAPRGALGHWLKVAESKIDAYQIITPTAWNASPHDDQERPGPIERALIGTSVQDRENLIELLRVVHSFDPCLACSVHTLHPCQVEKKPSCG
jgi:hydrogenase large subunit